MAWRILQGLSQLLMGLVEGQGREGEARFWQNWTATKGTQGWRLSGSCLTNRKNEIHRPQTVICRKVYFIIGSSREGTSQSSSTAGVHALSLGVNVVEVIARRPFRSNGTNLEEV